MFCAAISFQFVSCQRENIEKVERFLHKLNMPKMAKLTHNRHRSYLDSTGPQVFYDVTEAFYTAHKPQNVASNTITTVDDKIVACSLFVMKNHIEYATLTKPSLFLK